MTNREAGDPMDLSPVHLAEFRYEERLLRFNPLRHLKPHLDEKNIKIEKLVTEIHRSGEKLKEYRTAIISAAVTGKIDVRQGTADD